MSSFDIAAFVCYAIVAFIGIVFFIIYFARSEFMPYHKDAVETSWKEIDRKFQVLILAFIRALGGGWLAASISIIFLLIFPFQNGEKWSLFAIPSVGLAITLSTLYATLYIKRNTQAKPPSSLVVSSIILIIIGFFLSLF